ncbi:hypothetical protein WKW50_07300 [Ochrobactrum sp. GPK 3]
MQRESQPLVPFAQVNQMLQEKHGLSSQLVQTLQLCHFVTMTDEPKDVRLPFMVTASEAKAIDEWRYKNKIPSRAEAMRLLINRGLAFGVFETTSTTFLSLVSKLLSEEKLTSDDREKLRATVDSQTTALVQANKDIVAILELRIKELDKQLSDMSD